MFHPGAKVFELWKRMFLMLFLNAYIRRSIIKNSLIVRPQQIVDHMLFIVRGELVSVNDDGSKDELTGGSFCGEELFIFCLEHHIKSGIIIHPTNSSIIIYSLEIDIGLLHSLLNCISVCNLHIDVCIVKLRCQHTYIRCSDFILTVTKLPVKLEYLKSNNFRIALSNLYLQYNLFLKLCIIVYSAVSFHYICILCESIVSLIISYLFPIVSIIFHFSFFVFRLLVLTNALCRIWDEYETWSFL